MADYRIITEKIGNLEAIFPDCEKIMNLRVSLSKLEQVGCAVKNGVHRFKQRVDLHSTAAKIVQAINSPIFLACAAGYRIFRYIG